ncbi:class A beta-lactamase [Enterococcus sp. C78]|jgi:beta-lactamase class A|uniref:class A beta-lactamase n=1 Tax=Enterococcus sp. C78 TaxID=3231336 RepID=UPI0034A02665
MEMRNFFVGVLLLAGLCIYVFSNSGKSTDSSSENYNDGQKVVKKKIKEIENKYDAKLGIYSIDTHTKKFFNYNSNQRFAYTSTYKAIAGGILLKNLTDTELNKRIIFKQEDIVEYSPITQEYINNGMTLKEIIHAAIAYSDNTAGNILFNELGGPKGFEKELNKMGDTVTQADRYETALNQAVPGDLRDTTTPETFGKIFENLILSSKFEEKSYKFFLKTMIDNTTGNKLIRAGVPKGYEVGDKTGAGSYGTRNDIAFIQPKKMNKKPLIWVIFSNKKEKDAEYNDQLIAETARILSEYYKLN